MKIETSDILGVIPARFNSTRLLGKPLKLIGDKPMIQHVVERAQEAGASAVIVATDDPQFGVEKWVEPRQSDYMKEWSIASLLSIGIMPMLMRWNKGVERYGVIQSGSQSYPKLSSASAPTWRAWA